MDMQNNKNSKTVDEFGRILIPKSIRTRFGIKAGDVLCYDVEADRIILRRPVEKCIFCGSEENVKSVMGRPICLACKEKIKSND